MKRYIVVIISVLLIIFSICGCGGQKKNSGSSTPKKSFDYDIKVANSLPDELLSELGILIVSKCEVSKVTFEEQDGMLCAFIYGTKTYDQDGEYGDTPVKFKCVLKDSNQDIIAYEDIAIYDLIEGMKLGDKGYYGFKFTDISNLSKSETYSFELVDYEQ